MKMAKSIATLVALAVLLPRHVQGDTVDILDFINPLIGTINGGKYSPTWLSSRLIHF